MLQLIGSLGPYKINGVPLRRVNQRYVIATSTKIDVSGVNVDSINDDFFKRPAAPKTTQGEAFFHSKHDKTRKVTDQQKSEQKRVDSILIPTITKTELLRSYLKSNFALSNNQQPHKMRF